MKILLEEKVITKKEEVKFYKNDKLIYKKLKMFYKDLILEENEEIQEDGFNVKRFNEVIEKLNLNPITARQKNTYSFVNNSDEKTLTIQYSSIFTKFLLFVDLIFRVSNIYKYVKRESFTPVLSTIYDLMTIKLININYSLFLVQAKNNEIQYVNLIILAIW